MIDQASALADSACFRRERKKRVCIRFDSVFSARFLGASTYSTYVVFLQPCSLKGH